MCCYASDNEDLKKFHASKTNPFEYFLSDEMEDIRTDMFEGNHIKGCEICYNMETAGLKSYRQWKYNNIYSEVQDVEKVSLKLRIFGSYCNLGCYMCAPYNSSTRRKELKDTETHFPWNDEDVVHNIATKRYGEITQDILDNIELVDAIHITGGEPLLMPKVKSFLDRISDNHAKQITIYFDTNLTDIEILPDLIQKFKRIDLGVSCDHYGDKLAWIRYPIDVKKFEENLYSMANNVISINVTPSILNIDSLDEIVDYYSDFNINYDNVVVNPKILSIKNLPKNIKEKYIIKYLRYENVVNELRKESDANELAQGLQYCRNLNSQRNTNLHLLFPHLL